MEGSIDPEGPESPIDGDVFIEDVLILLEIPISTLDSVDGDVPIEDVVPLREGPSISVEIEVDPVVEDEDAPIAVCVTDLVGT